MAITPDKTQIEATGLEYVEPHEIVKDTGPKALNLLAQAVVDIQAKPASIPGDIPIFATLAEAEAWEAANPGRQALTIESTEPDTTPPTLGTMTITPEGTKAVASVSGATDDRGSVEYSFKLDSGAWTAWQASSTYTFTNLSLSTAYSATHRVRDRANNVVEGYSQSFTTLAEDLWGTLWSDSFANNPDGPLVGATLDTPSSTAWMGGVREPVQYNLEPEPVVTSGRISERGAAGVLLPQQPKRIELGIRSKGGNANRMAFPIIGGTGPEEYTYISISRASNQLSTVAFVDPDVRDYKVYGKALTRDDGSDVYSIGNDGWLEHLYTFELDYATLDFAVKQDGSELLRVTLPDGYIKPGGFVGFRTGHIDFASGGYLGSWHVRWE